MLELTPQVEPLSIDEAFMDLTGTARLHRMSAARALARFARRVETEIGITVSIGLSANKFLAKIASDLDKPRGFAVLGKDEAVAFLADKPVGFIWGVGKASAARLQRDGFNTVADLQRADESDLMRRYGVEGRRLCAARRAASTTAWSTPSARPRACRPRPRSTRTLPTTRRWRSCCGRCRKRCLRGSKQSGIAGSTITLKLKTADFRIRTRARSLGEPTQLAGRIFEAGRDLLRARDRRHKIPPDRHRRLEPRRRRQGRCVDLIVDRKGKRAAEAEHAIDKVREKFGKAAVVKGLVFDGAAAQADDEDEDEDEE